MKVKRSLAAAGLGLGLVLLLLWLLMGIAGADVAQADAATVPGRAVNKGTLAPAGAPASVTRVPASVSILVDDFIPQPYQGDASYYYNRLGGDRGALGESAGSVNTVWGYGEVTATIVFGTWGGVWQSLNHPDREKQPINFSAILPSQVLPQYQSQITGLTFRVMRGTPGVSLTLELKNGSSLQWSRQVTLSGGQQTFGFELPPLTDVTNLNWVIAPAEVGDYVVVERVALTATTSITDVAQAGFVWSYGMLLNSWNPTTGLVRDKSKDASGEFDAIQSTGSLAAATVMAEQLEVVSHADAVDIVTQISNTLLTDVPRYHGLWPHWVRLTSTNALTIVTGTEWSSVDTAIAAIALLEAQTALGLDTSGTEQMLEGIDWDALLMPDGISHGYSYTGTLIQSSWDTFGGESWLVQLAYASASQDAGLIRNCMPPTANGSGFIDELAWLFVPPPENDCWGNDWEQYRQEAVSNQLSYYSGVGYAPCLNQLDWFGLSAAEVPIPSHVTKTQIYQPFGTGGRFSSALDGSSLPGLYAPVVVPHYAAMIASLRPTEATSMWVQLIDPGPLSPLNNVESLMFPAGSSCDVSEAQWNQLKGTWNLVLQTLGWGRYWAEREGQVPILWQTVTSNTFLSEGYGFVASTPITAVRILGPSHAFTKTTVLFTATHEPESAPAPVTWAWDNGTTGNLATYTWQIPGTYAVVLTATNHCGGSITSTHSITITDVVLDRHTYLPLVLCSYRPPKHLRIDQ
jgi:hypothetical protein